MRLFELVLQNVPPQRIAQRVVDAVSNSNGDLTAIKKYFLHSIMDAIGFAYYVTTEEVSTMQFQWPEQEANYFIFHYERTVFNRYTIFLEHICRMLNQEQLLESLKIIVGAFLDLCESLEEPWDDNFWEPFSLISFSLLQSMHTIRKDEPDPILVLDSICDNLFENSQKGLGHSDSHDKVYEGLCVLLEYDYDHFHYFNENIFEFYINCMEYEFTAPKGQLFIHIKNAIENSNIPNAPRESLVKFVTDTKMIKAYCVFSEYGSKTLVKSLLVFLISLLSHLPALECFSREQVHTIFGNALQKNERIRSLAVKFYITYMKKSFIDKLILRDIMDFFLIKANDIEYLDDFIDSLWDEFQYIKRFAPYQRVLRKPNSNLKTLSIAAQFTVRVYQKLYKECEINNEYASQLSKFLMDLPSILILLENKWQIRGILMHIYSVTDPEIAIITIQGFPIAAGHFVKYAMQSVPEHNQDRTLVTNIAYNMLTLMDFFNMQDELVHFERSIYEKYMEIMSRSLDELSEDEVKILQHTLLLLSVLTDVSTEVNEKSVFELLSDLGMRLIDSTTFHDLAVKFNCFLDSVAITAYSGCLNILTILCSQISSDQSSTESSVLFGQVKSFLKYLLRLLGDDTESNVTNVLAESAIRALCDLYVVFNFKLEKRVYHILVNSVNKYVFEAPSPSSTDRLRQLERQQNILQCFNQLHKVVDIPVAITWKIIIHYGVSTHFQKELSELMDILFDYDSEKFKKPSLFTYVVPVAIYNLFQRRIRVPQFRKALKAYKTYVENKIPNKTQRILKVHIVLTTVDMIEKAIKAGDINIPANRMELLSNLNILLTDIYQRDRSLIVRQSRRLERHTLSRDERDTLSNFQRRLSQ